MKCLLCINLTKLGRKLCNSCTTKVRRHRAKLAAIKYLGGKCLNCGIENPAVLQFHHRNPAEKEFMLGNVGNKKWEVLKTELNKCDLLCANCHIEKHSTRDNEDFLKVVKAYKGRELDF